jgi:hypothetical protein
MEEKQNAQTEQKPFLLEIEEAKLEIIQAINSAIQIHKLPYYIIEMILANAHSQIKEGAKNELEMIKAQTDNIQEG